MAVSLNDSFRDFLFTWAKLTITSPAFMVFHPFFLFISLLCPFLGALGAEICISKRQICGFKHGCRKMPAQQFWAAPKHLATGERKSLPFPIKINVSGSGGSYRTAGSTHRLVFLLEKSWHTLLPLANTSAAPLGQVSQEDHKALPKISLSSCCSRCCTTTHKHIKIVVLETKGDSSLI